MDDSMVITLLRHGMTTSNVRKEYLGWSDSPLTEAGISEIKSKKAFLPVYQAIYSSDMPRCLKTANYLFPERQINLKTAFREMNFGKWEGKTYEQLLSDLSYQAWLENPFELRPPLGESYATFARRVQLGWGELVSELIEQEISSVALVTHGGVIRDLLVKYAPEKKRFWDWQTSFCSGYELKWECQQMLKEGERCTSLRVVPTTVKLNG